jgi:hypothetical protein
MRLPEGADYFAGRRLMNNRQFIIRVKDRAAYRRDEFSHYFRLYGWMHYTLPSQSHLCGVRGCSVGPRGTAWSRG